MSDRDLTCKNCGKEIESRGWTHDDSIFCELPGLQYAEPTLSAPVEPVPPQGKDVFLGTTDEAETQPGVWEWVPKSRLDKAEARIRELESAPVPAPRLGREFLDSLIDKRLPLVNPLHPHRYFIEPTRKTMREGAKVLRDAILEFTAPPVGTQE